MSSSVTPLLVNRADLCRMLRLSRRESYRLEDRGMLPKPVAFGTCKRWRVEELEAWTRAGCPPRKAWENLRSAASAPARGSAGQ